MFPFSIGGKDSGHTSERDGQGKSQHQRGGGRTSFSRDAPRSASADNDDVQSASVRWLGGQSAPLRVAAKRGAGVAALVMSTLFATHAVAQQGEKDQPPAQTSTETATSDDITALRRTNLVEIDPVVVTATRFPAPLSELGSSGTVITDTQLKQKQVRFISEALRSVPGVDIARGGGFGQLTSIFTRGTNSNHTLVLVDGVEVSDPSAFGGAFNFAHLTANNVARVEMIRGPQSAVWGSDAIGGVVNIITKRGRGPLRAFIEGEAGSYGTYRGAVGFSGGEEAIDYSLSASWFNTEGISAADTDFAGNGERDGYRSGSVASRVGLHFTEDFDTNLVVRYLNTQSDTDGGLGVAGDQIGREVDEEHWYLKVEPVLRLFDDQWEQRLSVTYTDISREDPLGFTPSFDGTRTRVGWHHTVTAVEQHTFSFGVESDRETYTDTGTHQQRAHLTSGYLQDHIAVVPETVFITLSGRVDHHDEFGSEWTWRVAPAWHLHETHTVLRGSYGTGFRAPSLPELYSAFGSPTLEPEESKGWDVGIDQSFFGEKLVVGATYFHNDIDQLVAGFPLANIGDATTQGVELSAVILPAENWSIRGSYTYLDTDDGAGGKLLRRADQQFSVDVSWDVVPEQVNLTLAAAYIGERADTDFSVFPGRPVTLDPYTLVTLAGRWRVDDNLEVFGRVENLLDDDYQEIYGAGEVGIGAYAGVRYTF